jgi:hypothetical protein
MPSPLPSSAALAGLPTGYAPELEVFFQAWLDLRRPGVLLARLSDYLDRPPYKLQPFVSILDLHGPDKVVVRLFGTALGAVAGQDFTKKPIEPIYPAQDLARAGAIAWASVVHPAGYVCVRKVRSAQGLALSCDCICLPLAAEDSAPKCLITFLRFPNQSPQPPPANATAVVTAFKFINWIDLGAGTPPFPAQLHGPQAQRSPNR